MRARLDLRKNSGGPGFDKRPASNLAGEGHLIYKTNWKRRGETEIPAKRIRLDQVFQIIQG